MENNAHANMVWFEGRSWTISDLFTEVKRLRTISEKQSTHLAQAMFEKNQLVGSDPAMICNLQRRNTDLQNAYISLRKRFEDAERCHARDFALLNRLKSILQDVLR